MICLACRRACSCKPLPRPSRVTGAQVRAFRAAIGWTQEQLAQAVGVTRLTIARWEGSEHSPSPLALQRLHLAAAAQGARLTSGLPS